MTLYMIQDEDRYTPGEDWIYESREDAQAQIDSWIAEQRKYSKEAEEEWYNRELLLFNNGFRKDEPVRIVLDNDSSLNYFWSVVEVNIHPAGTAPKSVEEEIEEEI